MTSSCSVTNMYVIIRVHTMAITLQYEYKSRMLNDNIVKYIFK